MSVLIFKVITVNVLKFLTPVSEKMAYANSADPDQTAPEVWVNTVSNSTKYFKK